MTIIFIQRYIKIKIYKIDKFLHHRLSEKAILVSGMSMSGSKVEQELNPKPPTTTSGQQARMDQILIFL